jgi:GntR family transcriptional repressor for pyruvate dehydrogenase complex
MAGIHSAGRVEEVMRRLETALLDGRLAAGTRLPPERQLAEQNQVSRTTIREAIQRLAARGLVRVKRGAGVFVTNELRSGMPSPWGQLLFDHPALRGDILEFRRVLEGATAYFAAQRATELDRTRISDYLSELEHLRKTGDNVTEAHVDAKLHEAIALASHNVMFLHLHTSILSMLREHITINCMGLRELDQDVSIQLLQQHHAICEAICSGQPEEARTAMHAHIDFVRARLKDEPI